MSLPENESAPAAPSALKFLLSSSFFRGFLGTFGVIFASSLCISHFGGAIWPTLTFYFQIATFAYFTVFLFLKSRSVVRSFALCLLLSALLAAAVPLAERPERLYVAFAIAMLFIELTGGIVLNLVKADMFGPHIIRSIDQKLVLPEMFGKLSAAAISPLAVSSLKPEYSFYLVALSALIYMLNVFVLLRLSRGAAFASDPAEKTENIPEFLRVLADNFLFLARNPFVKHLILLVIFTQLIRIVVLLQGYDSMGRLFPDLQGTTNVMSALSVITFICVFLFQTMAGRKLLFKRGLSVLLNILPLGILAISILELSFQNLWIPIFGILFFDFINKVVQVPATNQCFSSVPKSRRHAVYILSLIVVSLALAVGSGLMKALQEYEIDHVFSALLLVICAAALFVISLLDSNYIRSLWNQLLDFKSVAFDISDTPLVGQSETRPLARSVHRQDSEDGRDLRKAPMGEIERILFSPGTFIQRAHLLLDLYSTADSRERLDEISRVHKKLLASGDNDTFILGVTGLACLGHESAALQELRKSEKPHVGEFEKILLWMRQNRAPDLRPLTLRKYFLLIVSHYVQGAPFSMVEKFMGLLRIQGDRKKSILISALNEPAFEKIHPAIIASLDAHRQYFDVLFFLDCYLYQRFENSGPFRAVLIALGQAKLPRTKVRNKILQYVREVESQPPNEVSADTALKTLFLAEWLLMWNRKDLFLLKSFENPPAGGVARDLWKHLHSEFLKESAFAGLRRNVWKSL